MKPSLLPGVVFTDVTYTGHLPGAIPAKRISNISGVDSAEPDKVKLGSMESYVPFCSAGNWQVKSTERIFPCQKAAGVCPAL